jgi:hypothetical protein
LPSSTARARLRPFGATWTRAECGLGRRTDIEPETATYDVGANPPLVGGNKAASGTRSSGSPLNSGGLLTPTFGLCTAESKPRRAEVQVVLAL